MFKMQAFNLGQSDGSDGDNRLVSDDPGRVSGELTRDAVAAFASIVEKMSQIRDFHGEICGNLDQFADLVGHGSDDFSQFDALEQDVGKLLQALTDFSKLTVAPEARNYARQASSELELIDKNGHILSAIASLMGTTIASLGLQNLDTFLSELKQTAVSIQDATENVTGHIGGFDKRSRILLASCNKASSVLADLLRGLAAPRETLAQLSTNERQAAKEISGRARGLTRDGKSHLKSFVTAMQFSDRLAQRLDHLATMLTSIDAHVARLAAAQAKRCASDIESVSSEVRITMVQIADLGRSGAQVFSAGAVAEAIGNALAARANVVELVVRKIASVQDVVEVARTEAEHAAKLVTATGESFDGLKDASKNLALASYNSMLVSNRYSHASGPMKVLSREVRQIASDCLASVDNAQNGVSQITEGSGQAQQDLVDATNLIEQRLTSFRSQTETGENRLRNINDMRDRSGASAQSLLMMVDDVTDSMARVDRVAQQLLDLAQSLSALGDETAPMNSERINAIWENYTMDEERQVHAEVFGNQPGLTTVSSSEIPEIKGTEAQDDIDIDDMLF